MKKTERGKDDADTENKLYPFQVRVFAFFSSSVSERESLYITALLGSKRMMSVVPPLLSETDAAFCKHNQRVFSQVIIHPTAGS